MCLYPVHHIVAHSEDIKLIMDELVRSQVFVQNDKQKHSHFKKPKNLLHAKPKEDVMSRLCKQVNSRYFKIKSYRILFA